ncbi:hypothetical protein [Enterovirga rhinocerotis]|uniref:Uncharacterized protein n=1 Tax=Enterovirga rhinocerotis TaxID=1339210 RepID=A0A4R7BUZ0_9HYPH|nr:hypothetical protein [Enterovirga rhinocerotis]TDR89620.1 hypothetical protein EV668_2453 [Enterovirga rhinocerotis]
MTRRLDEAISQLRGLPPRDQDDAAAVIMSIVEARRPQMRLTPEQIEEVKRTEEGLLDGSVELLTVEQTEEMWRRLGA